MTPFKEYQKYLLLGKITGSLSFEEEQELELLLQKDILTRQTFEELKSEFPQEYIDTSFSKFKEPGRWKDIVATFREKEIKKTPVRFYYAIAASIVGIAIGIFLLYINNKNELASDSSNRHTKNIILQLAGGKTINLSAEKGNFKESYATFNNTGTTLKYTATGNEGNGINTINVPIGLDYKIMLEDGSIVWLNAASQLRFPLKFSSVTREVSVKGEAYFEIAKNSSKPFIVHLPNSTVQVMGTEFNVNTYDSGTVKVSLVNGAVNVKGAGKEISIKPGNEAVFANSSLKEQSFNIEHTTSWRKGTFYFEASTLEEISRVLPRWYGINVIIDNPNILQRKFTGAVDKNDSIGVFMEDIKAISGINSYLDKDNTLHFK